MARRTDCISALGRFKIKDPATALWRESDVGFIIPQEAENENQKEEQESGGEEELAEDPERGKDQPLKSHPGSLS